MDFDQQIQHLMRIGHIPSLSASIIKNGKMVWYQGYGWYDRKNRKRPSEDTTYMLGSPSKIITALALMQLYEKGLFHLDDDTNIYLPFSLRNPKYPDVPITFRMLLAHQSSLYDHKVSLFKLLKIYRKSRPLSQTIYPWIQELLTPKGRLYEKSLWMEYPPGEKTRYASIGYVLLGYVLEVMTHQSIEQYCKEHIFEPLHMKNTGFHPSELKSDTLAIPYVYIAGIFLPLPHYDLRFLSSAGGIRTSIHDLSTLLCLHVNKGEYNGTRLLKKETVELMHSIQYPHSNIYRDKRYGLGWFFWMQGTKKIYEGNAGAIYGFYGEIRVRCSDKTTVIFYTNQLKNIILLREAWAFRNILKVLFEKADTIESDIS